MINKYTYDEQSQLIQDDNLVTNITTKYEYDNYGNILSKKQYTYNTENLIKEDTYTYGDSNWQDLLTKFNDKEITYDEIGNPITIGSKTLSWMDGRSLREYKDGSTTITYSYNLDGIRTEKKVGSTTIKYYLNGMNIVFEDRAGSVLYYIYNEDEVLGFVYEGVTYYYHKNILGDVIGILDSNYQEIVTYSYDAYGNILSMVDNSTNNIGEVNPFRYRSYYYDVEANLYYLNSRYYNPETGRFLNADSIVCSNADIVSYNLYAYVSNNPINYKDKNGNGIFSNLLSKLSSLLIKKANAPSTVKSIKKNNVVLSSSGHTNDIPLFGDPYSHEISPDGTKERWRDEDGNPFKDRHHTNHGNEKKHPMVPHDQYWKKGPNGNWTLQPDPYEPRDDDIPRPGAEKLITGATVVGTIYLGYLGAKWIAATIAAPVTGGASIGVALVTP